MSVSDALVSLGGKPNVGSLFFQRPRCRFHLNFYRERQKKRACPLNAGPSFGSREKKSRTRKLGTIKLRNLPGKRLARLRKYSEQEKLWRAPPPKDRSFSPSLVYRQGLRDSSRRRRCKTVCPVVDHSTNEYVK